MVIFGDCFKTRSQNSMGPKATYLFQLIRKTNANPELFIYVFPGKHFELRLKYIKKCHYNCEYSTILSGKNTRKANKQKFVIRKIGCSHELKEIIFWLQMLSTIFEKLPILQIWSRIVTKLHIVKKSLFYLHVNVSQCHNAEVDFASTKALHCYFYVLYTFLHFSFHSFLQEKPKHQEKGFDSMLKSSWL